MKRTLLLLPLLLTACESGLDRGVKVTVPITVAAQFNATTPGVLVSDMSGEARPYVVLCGQQLGTPIQLSQDLGFGCLGQRDGTEETIRVWIEPLPSADGVQCSSQRSFYEDLGFGSADAGPPVLATTPDAAWAQGSGSGKWGRDVSPCGGSLSVDVTLSAP